MSELHADPDRFLAVYGSTGIYVRAKTENGWASVDIAELTLESLRDWLRQGGTNPIAERTVAVMLGHNSERITEVFP